MRRIDENTIPNCVQYIDDNVVHADNYAYWNASDDFTLKMTVTTGKLVYVDWGDGQKQQWVADGTEKTVAHDYASAGAYKIKVFGDIAKVTTIDLSSQANVSGDIVGFKKLSGLTKLWLNTTSFSGSLSEISTLTSLTTIRLYLTSISGELSNLSNLTSLTYLFIGDSSITGDIGDLDTLTSVTYLRAQNISITGDIGDLSTLTSLTHLYLDGTSVSGDIADLATLTSIAYMWAFNTNVDYTTGTLQDLASADVRIYSTELQSSGEVDQFLIDYAAAISGGSGGVLNIAGDNAARTAASDAAKATILAASVTLTVNE